MERTIMKLGVITTLFVVMCTKTSAQDYKPMLVDGRVWEWYEQKSETDGSRHGIYHDYVKYTVLGDTVVDGFQCKNVLRQEAINDSGEIRQYFEKDRKFFYLAPMYKTHEPVCYMDFGANIGDDVQVLDICPFELMAVDSIMVKGQKYRRLTFDMYMIWVEGIGCNFRVYPPIDDNFHVYDNGVEIFDWSGFTADSITSIPEAKEPEESPTETIFDLHGRRVLKPEKGQVYIINGEKRKF